MFTQLRNVNVHHPYGISHLTLKALPNKSVATLIGTINAMLRLSHWECANVEVLP